MKFFTMEQLAAGIKDRHVGAERARLVEKWSRTGLLRGLDGHKREAMAQLLENQAAQVLREVGNSLSTGGGNVASSGQIQGFTNIAFPIVRRVFGGLVANELVSIQPMSLPSGLIFYLDYTYGSNVGGNAGPDLTTTGAGSQAAMATYQSGQSIYNNPTGKGIQSGSLATGGMYDLVNIGYSKVQLNGWVGPNGNVYSTGSSGQIGAWNNTNGSFMVGGLISAMSGVNGQLCNFDQQLDVDMSSQNLNAVFLYLNVADMQPLFRTAISSASSRSRSSPSAVRQHRRATAASPLGARPTRAASASSTCGASTSAATSPARASLSTPSTAPRSRLSCRPLRWAAPGLVQAPQAPRWCSRVVVPVEPAPARPSSRWPSLMPCRWTAARTARP